MHLPLLTLRTKGVLALTVLILYIALVAVFANYQRQKLFFLVQEIESNHSRQAFLTPVFNNLANSLIETQAILSSPEYSNGRYPPYERFAEHIDPLGASLPKVQQVYSLLAKDIGNLEMAVDSLRAISNVRHLTGVRDSEQKLLTKVHAILTALQTRSGELSQSYHDTQQYINVVALSANITGAVVSVVVILFFFTNLAKDIKRLQDRAVAVVAGYDGQPLINNRRDEIGGLINAVNRMQVDLRRWEQQQEVSRQQRFHQEKMAAVGSLAAAIGHEVSNPIAAISGVAQVMIDETRDDNRKASKVLHDFAQQIFKQTERVALIMQQMATLTTPHSPEPELLDLNSLIQSTCSFITYDKRFAGIEFELALDREIPAVTAVADHITQILMNLLINAADALHQASEPGRSRIRIATCVVGTQIYLSVSDNGHGMSSEVLAKAFDESFTTKPAGKGRGIGLFLCKTLIKEAGGRIELTSTPGAGTTAGLYLPLNPGAN